MPGWSGCDVCELPEFRVQLTIYVPEWFDLAGPDSPLPPGDYILAPVESYDARYPEQRPDRGLRVVAKSIDGAPPLEEAKRDCMRAARRDEPSRRG